MKFTLKYCVTCKVERPRDRWKLVITEKGRPKWKCIRCIEMSKEVMRAKKMEGRLVE